VTNQILVAEQAVQSKYVIAPHVYKSRAATFCWQNSRHKASESGYFSRLVSELLLAQIDATNRKPKRRFLLGLGEPFEPNPWPDISDSEDDEKEFLMASQMVEKEHTQSKQLLSDRWGSPKSFAKLDLLRKEGTPKST